MATSVGCHRKSDGKYGQLKLGHGNLIYFDGAFPNGRQYKVTSGMITCHGSKVHDNEDFQEFMRKIGYIKWFCFSHKKRIVINPFFIAKFLYFI